jgi:thiol-disulfide isomerase/thioredoxin
MKKLMIAFAFLILASCANKKDDATNESKKTSAATSVSISEGELENMIPSYNFKELNQFLTKENDTTYVVNFWATWCRPCIKEIPAFEQLNADYSEEKVKVLLVSLDFPNKIEKQVIPFIEKNNIQSQVVLLDDDDSNTWIPLVSEEWSGAIPATIIYNKTTRKFYERSFTYNELVEELKLIM